MLRELRAASDELLHLDLMRFVAACGIVLLHFARFLSPQTRAMLGPVGGLTIFVDLFFVISGFVIAYVYAGRIANLGDYATFLRRRVARLAPLHWATLLFFVALGILVWSGRIASDHADFYDPRCLLPNAIAIHAWGLCPSLSFNDVSWSISAELGMYLLAPVLLAVAARSPGTLCVIAIASIAWLSALPQQPWLGWTWHLGVARAFPSFALGVALAHRQDLIARLPAPRVVATAAFLLLLAGIRLEWERLALLPLVYAIVVAAIAADVGGRYAPPRIGVLGQLSYSLYMLHPVVRTAVIGFVGQRVLRLDGAAADAMVAAGFLLSVALAYLSFTLFETPMRRWIAHPRRHSPALAASA